MPLQIKKELITDQRTTVDRSKVNKCIFSKDYVDFLSDAGWRLEKKLPSNISNYLDLL